MATKVHLEDLLAAVSPAALDTPCSDDDLMELALGLSDWRVVALYLRLEDGEMADIEERGKSVLEKSVMMLRKWRQKFGEHATYRSLAGVLWKLGRTDMVEKICELLSAPSPLSAPDKSVTTSSHGSPPTAAPADRSVMTSSHGSLPTAAPAKSVMTSSHGSPPTAAPAKSVMTSSHGSPPTAAPADRSVMTSYADYLRGRYRSYTPACAIQFPPSPTRKYFNLALIKKEESEQGAENEELVRLTMEGQISKILEKRVPVKLEEICQLDKSERKVILIEGAPGSGKSTLSWHICQKWESGELFQQFSLVVYVQLRDPAIQAAQSVADLLPRRNDQMAQDVLSEIEDRDGESVLFVMDGWDELPPQLQQQSLFRRLINLPVASSLHRSAVIVTSRPESSAELHSQVSSRIQIVGFTPTEVKEFFTESLKGDSQAVNTLMEQMRDNPVIESSCYLPLNAAIIVGLFLSLNFTLPTTITGVFTSLVLCCILRHLKARTDMRIHTLHSLDSLPEIVQGSFAALCQLAFHGILDGKVTFSADELSRILPDTAHLSLLQAVESFSYLGPAGTSRTYNFLHLSVQEFLAAWHITKLPANEQTDLTAVLVDQPGMLRFYCGITNLSTPEMQEQIVRYCTVYGEWELLKLLNYIHEADNLEMYQYTATKLSGKGPHTLDFLDVPLSPADCLSLGCYLPWACCADSNLPRCLVSDLDGRCVELLMKGLMKNVAKIHKLPCDLEFALCNCDFSSSGVHSIAQVLQSANCILREIKFYYTPLGVDGLKCLAEAVAKNTSLKCLGVSAAITEENGPAVCEMLEKNKTLLTLTLFNCEVSDLGVFYIKKGLLCNTTLQHLVIRKSNISMSNNEAVLLAGMLKLTCSLKQLTLACNRISNDQCAQIADALAVNTSLQQLHFNGSISDISVFHLAEALKNNTTLQHLDLSCPLGVGCKYLAEALTVNSSLKCLGLNVQHHTISHMVNSLVVNTSLQELRLMSFISYGEIPLLAESLKCNHTLKVLRLGESYLTVADVESLATALTVNKTLELLDFDGCVISNPNQVTERLLQSGVLQKLLGISIERLVERFGEEQAYVTLLQELEEWEAAQA